MKKHYSIILLSLLFSSGIQQSINSTTLCIGTDILQDTSKSKQPVLKQPVYFTQRLSTSRPIIDGKLDDDCWKTGTWAGDFTQWIPNEGAKPTWPTVFNLQYDDKYLYVAIRAFEGEPEKMVRMASPRDEYSGDVVGISFDSYRNFKTGFEFNVSSWGQKTDDILFNPISWDVNWNAAWKAKTGIEDSAWVVEYEIPLSQLRYSNQKEQVWGMHSWRWISRLSEESDWEKQTKNGPGMLYNFGELRGIKDLKKSRRIEILPYALGDLKTMKEVPGNPFTTNGRVIGGNAGLDAKIGVTSNFTLDLSVNPDFGQVESDPSVMNLSVYETFYDEKRPFFLEGLTIFDYKFDNQSLFYSRRIGHAPSLNLDPNDTTFIKSPDKSTILSALKFSGTTSKGLSVGVIQSLTANEKAEIAYTDGKRTTRSVEPLTSYTVARVQQGYNSGNTFFGGMLTSVNRFINNNEFDFLSRNAYTGGFDFLHYWNDKEYYVDARLIGSHVNGSREAITALQESSARYFQRPDGGYLGYDTLRTQLDGHGGKIKIGKLSKKHWKYSTGISWLSPGLELNDLGYMNYADQIRNDNLISYQITNPVSVFHSYDIDFEQFNSWNFNGTFLGSGAEISFSSEFINNWSFSTDVDYRTGVNDTRFLRGGPTMILPYIIMHDAELATDRSKKVVAYFSYQFRQRGNNSATSYTLNPGITIRPFQALKIGVSADLYNNNDLLQYITTKNYLNSKRYIFGTLDQSTIGLTFRADLFITPEFSIQYYGSPFISRGSYSEFKYISNPDAKNFNDRFRNYNLTEINNGRYGLDENGDLNADYFIGNPDFNFHQFRSNLVAKWEYRLGSFIYLIWSSEMTGNSDLSHASYGESIDQLRKVFANNMFLVKVNYWFSL